MGQRAIAVLALGAVVLTACSSPIPGEATSSLWDPNNVGGLSLTNGPSGIRPDAPAPEGKVAYTDGGPVDRLALLSVNDVAEFWEQNYSPTLEGTFAPVENFASYDSDDPNSPILCGQRGYGDPNAFSAIPST